MSQHSLLIRCAPTRAADRADIERWLAGRVHALAGEGALLYHFAPPQTGVTADGRGEAWVVEFGAAGETAKPGTIPVLLADMWMLGLDPAVFRAESE